MGDCNGISTEDYSASDEIFSNCEIYDKASPSITDGSLGAGQLGNSSEFFKDHQSRTPQIGAAVALRERGSTKYSKKLICALSLPNGISTLLKH